MYDQKCYELATHFLGEEKDTEAHRKALAQLIQDTCEEYVADVEEQFQLETKS